MTEQNQNRSEDLRKHGITLAYLAKVAGRSEGYVRLWSCGRAVSPYLDKVAADLVEKRVEELAEAGV